MAEGRKVQLRIPLESRDFPQPPQILEEGDILRTKEQNTLLIVKEKDPGDKRALVLFAVNSGVYGGCQMTGTHKVFKPCGLRGVEREEEYTPRCPFCGEKYERVHPLGLFSARSLYRHPNRGGRENYPEVPPGVTILAKGSITRGSGHGRKRWWDPRILAVVEPGAAVRFLRSGRTYAEPAELIFRWNGEGWSRSTKTAMELGE